MKSSWMRASLSIPGVARSQMQDKAHRRRVSDLPARGHASSWRPTAAEFPPSGAVQAVHAGLRIVRAGTRSRPYRPDGSGWPAAEHLSAHLAGRRGTVASDGEGWSPRATSSMGGDGPRRCSVPRSTSAVRAGRSPSVRERRVLVGEAATASVMSTVTGSVRPRSGEFLPRDSQGVRLHHRRLIAIFSRPRGCGCVDQADAVVRGQPGAEHRPLMPGRDAPTPERETARIHAAREHEPQRRSHCC